MASKITAAISYSRNWLSSALLNASFLLAPKQRITASIWGRGGQNWNFESQRKTSYRNDRAEHRQCWQLAAGYKPFLIVLSFIFCALLTDCSMSFFSLLKIFFSRSPKK